MDKVRTSDFKKLIVWQRAIMLAKETYLLCNLLPVHETHALSSQLRRSSISVSSNIAEGHGRESIKEFIRFLLIAKGSTYEVESQCWAGVEIGYFTENQIYVVTSLCAEVSRMIKSLIDYLKALKS